MYALPRVEWLARCEGAEHRRATARRAARVGGRRDEVQHRHRDAGVDVRLDLAAARLGVAEDEQVVDRLRAGSRPSRPCDRRTYHASHIGRSASPRPSHSWNAAYTGTLRYAAIMRRPRKSIERARPPSCRRRCGRRSRRFAGSLPGLARALACAPRRHFGTSLAPSQLMIAPSDSAPASRSMRSRSAAM